MLASMDLPPRRQRETALFRRGYVPLEPISTTSGRLGVYLGAFIGGIATEYGRGVLDMVPKTILLPALLGLVGIEWLARRRAMAKANESAGGDDARSRGTRGRAVRLGGDRGGSGGAA
jgi:hypothetical protein